MIHWRLLSRIALCLAAGVLLAWLMNEITFRFLKSNGSRAPEIIELEIPEGTAARVARGEQQPSLPEGMVFVIGDTLVIKNDDTENHQLGPLFIPAGTKASMKFNNTDKYSYACSFVPDKTFGLDVQLPVTALTRFTGALFAGLPLGALIALYSFVLRPSAKKIPSQA